jgi:hypothetical protein
MKKLIFLIIFCWLGQTGQADLIVEKLPPPDKITFKVINLKQFTDYQFFTINQKGKKNTYRQGKEIERGLYALDKNGKQHQSLSEIYAVSDSLLQANKRGNRVEKIIKYVKITQIENGKIYLQTEKTEYIYLDSRKVTIKGSILENSILGIISFIALLSFMGLMYFRKKM